MLEYTRDGARTRPRPRRRAVGYAGVVAGLTQASGAYQAVDEHVHWTSLLRLYGRAYRQWTCRLSSAGVGPESKAPPKYHCTETALGRPSQPAQTGAHSKIGCSRTCSKDDAESLERFFCCQIFFFFNLAPPPPPSLSARPHLLADGLPSATDLALNG